MFLKQVRYIQKRVFFWLFKGILSRGKAGDQAGGKINS
jgi:hypothetical protein